MPAEFASYLTHYGYIAIFSLVFIQELGVPNPVPTEIALLFSGYLASINVLSFPLVFITVVSADFIGTTALYLIFYHFGEYILAHKPKWLPISRDNIRKISDRISKRGRWGIFIGRLLPYLRGYASVAAGLLEIKPKVFLSVVIFSAIIWSGGYSIAGMLLGPYWEVVAQRIGGFEKSLVLIVAGVLLFFVLKYLIKKWRFRRNLIA